MMIDCLENKQPLMSNGQQQNFQPMGTILQPPPVPIQQSRITSLGQQNQLLPIGNNQYSQQRQALQTQQTLTSNDGANEMLIKIDSQSLQPSIGSNNNNDLIGYYFGSISRETAEWILKTHGSQMDGTYLLRSSGPNDDFVLSLLVVNSLIGQQNQPPLLNMEVLHYKIVETEDSFVALHGQVGDEKFTTIDELIDKAQGVATKPRWPIQRQSLESHILPPTYWGLTVDQVRLAILIKAKQWGFPMFSSLIQQQANSNIDQQQQHILPNGSYSNNIQQNDSGSNITTLNNETIRTLIYKSLHEFQPWFHGKISREEAEKRIEEGGLQRDGRFLVRERDNYSYAMCISHKKTTKHYRIDVLPTGELAIQDGRKFTSLMALVSHYTIMSDGLWCALTEACLRPIQLNNTNQAKSFPKGVASGNFIQQPTTANQYNSSTSQSMTTYNQQQQASNSNNNLYCRPVFIGGGGSINGHNMMLPPASMKNSIENGPTKILGCAKAYQQSDNSIRNIAPAIATSATQQPGLVNANQVVGSNSAQIKAPIKEWLQTINHKWSQFISSKNQHQLNSFLFGSSNPLNNHCRHNGSNSSGRNHHVRHHHRHDHSNNNNNRASTNNNNSHHHHHRRKSKTSCSQPASCNACLTQSHVPSNEMNLDKPRFKPPMGHVDGTLNTIRRTSCNCCPIPPSIGQQQQQQNFAVALPVQQPPPLQLADSDINLNLGSNGFSLNGQSFVGSTLFAVNSIGNANREATLLMGARKGPGSSGSTNSNSSSSGVHKDNNNNNNNNNINPTGDEKLISPAQSISANLNNCNPYSSSTDIDNKSIAASTVLMRDQRQLPTNSSSSSSGGCNMLINGASNRQPKHNALLPSSYNDLVNQLNASDDNAFPTNQLNVVSASQRQLPTSKMQPQVPIHQPISHSGGIFCGQHAGPAYRYTNCTGNENLDPCLHHQPIRPFAPSRHGQILCRASDDSQLLTTGTQLTGPAALTKFVQFQDGQCLRTHRDARSIQMAYLLASRQANNIDQMNQQKQHGMFGQLNLRTMALNGQQQNTTTSGNYNFKFNANSGVSLNSRSQAKGDANATTGHKHQMQGQNQTRTRQDQDIDLIDCNGEGFNFKYDPKLIKSSSIETLCGIGEDEQQQQQQKLSSDDDDYDLTNFKTNSELVMSLKPCWFGVQTENHHTESDILYPIPAYQQQQTNLISDQVANVFDESNCSQQQQTQSQQQQSESLISSLMADAANESVNRSEHYDCLRKKHDLDELTTNLLTELTASLKAQIDLKNKRSGFINSDAIGAQTTFHNSVKQTNPLIDPQQVPNQHHKQARDPRELAYEFDTLIQSNINNGDNNNNRQ